MNLKTQWIQREVTLIDQIEYINNKKKVERFYSNVIHSSKILKEMEGMNHGIFRSLYKRK